MTSLLVSIVTPSYNQAAYIQTTLESVQNQTYRPLEHIIMDGGSTDGTVDLLNAYQRNAHSVEVTWVSEKDGGQANAINKGLKRARGEIVGWLNSDDVYFSKDVIERVVTTFQNNPQVDIVHGDVAKIGADNLIQFIWCIPEFQYDRMYVDGKVSQPTVFFRRKVFEEHALRENFLALDYEFWLRVGRSYQFKHLHAILAGDREQPNRISIRQKAALMQSHRQAQDEYFPNPPKIKTRWYRATSFPYRFLLRVKGLAQLVRLFSRPGWQETLAFHGWIDQKPRVMYRQMFQRIR